MESRDRGGTPSHQRALLPLLAVGDRLVRWKGDDQVANCVVLLSQSTASVERGYLALIRNGSWFTKETRGTESPHRPPRDRERALRVGAPGPVAITALQPALQGACVLTLFGR